MKEACDKTILYFITIGNTNLRKYSECGKLCEVDPFEMQKKLIGIDREKLRVCDDDQF